MKKILIITYYWPPSGGAGVQRWLKFAKYLPGYGLQPIILTVDPDHASYPQLDESLQDEVGSDCLVFKTKSFELYKLYEMVSGQKGIPYGGFARETKETGLQKFSKFIRGNLLIPDPRKGWNKYAIKKAGQLIKEFDIDTVITTSPPHSTQLIGLKLKEKLGIRWIADLRDPWTDIYYYQQFKHTALARNIDREYERKVLENADLLITVSEDVKRLFAEKSKLPIAGKTVVIPNGFDEKDFEIRHMATDHKKIITYSGTIAESYDVSGLIKAFDQLDAKLKSEITIRFVGTVPDKILEGFRLAGIEIELMGYVSHMKSIEYLLRSTLLLLVLPNVKNNKGIVTGKFFEYLASRKPILAIGPIDGDLADMIKQTSCGKIFDYKNAEGMAQYLVKILSSDPVYNQSENISAYSRKQLASKIAQLIKY